MSMICIFCGKSIQNIDKATLECKHTFHFRCLFKSSRQNESCPICNDILLENKMQHEPIVQERLRLERQESEPLLKQCISCLLHMDDDLIKIIGFILLIFITTIAINYNIKSEVESAIKINDINAIKKLMKRSLIYGDIKIHALCVSAKYGQITILNYLISLNVDLHGDNDCAYKNAIDNLQYKYVEHLKRNY